MILFFEFAKSWTELVKNAKTSFHVMLQKFLQSTTVRVEEMRVKRRDAEQWMSHRMLPENLKERIRRYDQYKWQETRGVEEDTLVRNLPKDLRKDIKRHLCLALVKRVSVFTKSSFIVICPSISRYFHCFAFP